MASKKDAKEVVQVKAVSAKIAGRTLIDNVSFTIKAGEIVGIIGPNGGGKTTLLKAILGLMDYEGEVVMAPGTTIGYVPQYFDFDRTMPLTTKEFLRLKKGKSLMNSTRDKEIKKSLKQVGAHKVFERKLGVLSGGELQRILIANALLDNPDLLILDEPSTGIDLGGEETIYSLIKKLVRERDLTIIFVSHDLDVVFRFATFVVCLNRVMTCVGPPQDVLTDETLSKTHGSLTTPFSHHRHT